MVNQHKTFPKLFIGFNMIRVSDNAVIDWADFLTGWHIVMPDTFGTKIRVNHIDFIAHLNRLIGAFWFAHIAICAFMSDQ